MSSCDKAASTAASFTRLQSLPVYGVTEPRPSVTPLLPQRTPIGPLTTRKQFRSKLFKMGREYITDPAKLLQTLTWPTFRVISAVEVKDASVPLLKQPHSPFYVSVHQELMIDYQTRVQEIKKTTKNAAYHLARHTMPLSHARRFPSRSSCQIARA